MAREPLRKAETPWHSLAAGEVCARLGVDPHAGLSVGEAAERLARHGRNEISRRSGHGPLVRFLLHFHAPLVYVLLVAGGAALLLGERIDSAVIFGVVLVNAVIGFVQESRAINAIGALSRSMVAEATCLRGGERTRVDASALVPGDIVLLASGDRVPADARLIEGRDLHTDESPLTGESLPVSKSAEALAEGTALADRRCMVYATTLVTRGHASAVVTGTGDGTEVGRISELISGVDELATPLMRRIASFSRLLLWLILGVSAAAFATALARGWSAVEAFLATVALAVGAIPEGLPAAMTIMLAVGVSRMASRRAIIRRLSAVEALGSTTVICSDKTGTLTQNQMTVRVVAAGGERFEVGGSGYDPAGEIRRGGVAVEPGSCPALVECLRAAALCNDASLLRSDDGWGIRGDPTEAAMIVAARKAGLTMEELEERFPRLDAIPFESDRQYMATLHADAGSEGGRLICVKGSVERTLEMCDGALDALGAPVPLDSERIVREVGEMSLSGLRVLAVACAVPPAGTEDLTHPMVEHGLTFLGVQGMMDPPRPEAIEAVRTCRRAGIRVKMITGDHALTASSIAAMIGIEDTPPGERALPVLTGGELSKVADADLPRLAEATSVFARMTPEQKLRLVRALQSRGHIVAMTGDGVNDAPALRQADIGVAMGIAGTEVAKEAADMVLADDNFASIKAAVEEGRTVFDNLTKFIVWTLPTNGGVALVILASIAAGRTLPILPVQALYINMATAILLGMPLVFEPMERDVMLRPPRDPAAPLLSFELMMRTGLVSLLLLVLSYGVFLIEMWRTGEEAAARTATVSVVVIGEAFYLLNCRSLVRSIGSVGWFSNPVVWMGIGAMVMVQVLFAHTAVMNRVMGSAPLDASAWLLVTAAGMVVGLVVGFEKWARRRHAALRGRAAPAPA